MSAPVSAESRLPGRTKIAARAVRRVVSAVTADALEVPARDVSVDLEDHGGQLSVTAGAPVRIDPLGTAGGSLRGPRGGTLVERLGTARDEIGERVTTLTGSRVTRVDLRITGADLTRGTTTRRVQ